MAISAFFGHRRVPRYKGNIFVQWPSIKISYYDPVFMEYRYFIIVEEYHLFGMAQKARTSEARKYSPSPSPITRGLSFLTAII